MGSSLVISKQPQNLTWPPSLQHLCDAPRCSTRSPVPAQTPACLKLSWHLLLPFLFFHACLCLPAQPEDIQRPGHPITWTGILDIAHLSPSARSTLLNHPSLPQKAGLIIFHKTSASLSLKPQNDVFRRNLQRPSGRIKPSGAGLRSAFLHTVLQRCALHTVTASPATTESAALGI